MPYISTEEAKEIRQAIRKQFPDYNISVTKEDCTVLQICIMETDIEFTAINKYTNKLEQVEQINEFWIDSTFKENIRARDFLNSLLETINTKKEQKIISVDSDYGSIPNYYLRLRVGKWDKPYKLIAK